MLSNLPNTLCKTIVNGNLDLNGNLFMNSQNVYLGYLAGNANPGGVVNVDNMNNVAIGASCATYQTGSKNVSIGYDAATNGTITYSGANNVSIGYNSGFNSCSTSNGVALGVNSLVDFSGSIAIGSAATATGFRNIAIGASATSSGTASKGNSIAIGVGASTGTYGNSVAIGSGATSTANNEITIGTNSNTIYFPGMLNNYGSYKLNATNNSISGNTICKFDSAIVPCNLISYDGSGSFMNVSGRRLVIFMSYSFIGNFASTSFATAVAFITKNNNRDQVNTIPLQLQTVLNIEDNINAYARMTVSAIDVFNPNDTFECWARFDGPVSSTTFNNSVNGNNICSFVSF